MVCFDGGFFHAIWAACKMGIEDGQHTLKGTPRLQMGEYILWLLVTSKVCVLFAAEKTRIMLDRTMWKSQMTFQLFTTYFIFKNSETLIEIPKKRYREISKRETWKPVRYIQKTITKIITTWAQPVLWKNILFMILTGCCHKFYDMILAVAINSMNKSCQIWTELFLISFFYWISNITDFLKC